MENEFHEVQKFTQWWLWLVLASIGLIPLIGIYKLIMGGDAFVESAGLELILSSILIVFVIGLFLLMKLETKIDNKTIEMSFFPFVKKKIKWSDIKSAEVVNYGFVGGWGIRLFTTYGTVYNMKGNKGLAIELVNGKKYVIGTQKETELRGFINKTSTVNT